jgi:hypothetical protein
MNITVNYEEGMKPVMKFSNKMNCVRILVLAVATSLFSTAYAAPGGQGDPGVFNPNSDALTITNSISEVDGFIGGFDDQGNILYPISGPVYATMVNPSTGETMGAVQESGEVNAVPVFDASFFGLDNPANWPDLGVLRWNMAEFAMSIGGTTFTIIDEMPFEGHAFPGLGPVENPMATGTLALRMAGCAGVQANDEGRYANKVGSLCLNGTFTFEANFDGKGVSNCTIVLHDPLQ